MSSHPEEVEKYSGKWIAVTDRGIIAAGDSVSEVTAILRKKGIKAMVMKVPRKDEEMSIL
jgi:predicted phosphoribosyltransferase